MNALTRKFFCFMAAVLGFSAIICAPAPCIAGELETGVREIVQDFERHILNAGIDKKYYVVVRSFVDRDTEKPKIICSEIEDALVDVIIEKFSALQNIVVLERKRIEALEKEVHFETDQTHFQAGEWDKKLGKKLGAGFLITGTVAKMSSKIKIRAKMVDIVTGAVLASSSVRVPIDEIDESLLADYESVKKKKAGSGRPGKDAQPYGSDSNKDFYNQGGVQPAAAMGVFCCDAFGNRRCQLVEPMPLGSSCFCIGQGWGVVCQ